MNARVGIVDRWFGNGAHRLHPALRELHERGGRLVGDVDVYVAANAAGRRLARRMGLRTGPSRVRMEVDVVPEEHAFLWVRRFDGRPALSSRFAPIGAWPEGAWREQTGRLAFDFGVDVTDGGWRWVQRAVRCGGVRLPAALSPTVRGDKRMVGGHYRFDVALSLPLLGDVLRYGGLLDVAD